MRQVFKTIAVSITSMAVSATIGLAVTGGITSTPYTQAKAATPTTTATDGPPCGYDVYKSKVYIESLGKAHGTVRVIKWTKPYSYDGKPRGIGTLVATKPIKRGQSITINRPKHTEANRITVDIVKGKLTRNESDKKVWRCNPA